MYIFFHTNQCLLALALARNRKLPKKIDLRINIRTDRAVRLAKQRNQLCVGNQRLIAGLVVVDKELERLLRCKA